MGKAAPAGGGRGGKRAARGPGRLARRAGLSRGSVHRGGPAHDDGAAHPAPHGSGRADAGARGLPPAVRGTARLPEGTCRPTGRVHAQPLSAEYMRLYFHPFASFCQKVLVALYENDVPFEPHVVDLGDEASSAEFKRIWPIGKFPVLRDEARARTIPESSMIIEYLARHYPGKIELIPDDAHRNAAAYLGRLMERSSFARVVEEAKPYRALFPK